MNTHSTSEAVTDGGAGAVSEHTPAGTQAPLGTDATSPAPGVPAGLLREAARRIRHDVEFGQAHGDDTFLLAVADWLESTANDVEHVHTAIYNLTSTTVARALAVAAAYHCGRGE